MSADSLWDVQSGLYTVLTGTAALTAQLADGASSILDYVPANTDFPYVLIGDARAAPLDTQGGGGAEVTFTLETYSITPGMQEVRKIMSSIYDALHNASFTVPHQTLIQCQCLEAATTVLVDSSGGAQNTLIRQGTQRFRIITEPA